MQCAENRIWEPVYCFNKLKEKHAIWIVPVIPGLANLKTREEVVQEIEVEYTAQDKVCHVKPLPLCNASG